jgi:hypothetical protein
MLKRSDFPQEKKFGKSQFPIESPENLQGSGFSG